MSYYDSCPFPKPVDRKKKKKTNGYKNKYKRICYYCKTGGAQRHEVYAGANRQICIDNGFQADLCIKCHDEMQHTRTDRGKERDLYWKQHYQKEWEEKMTKQGFTREQARAAWLDPRFIGRSYL